MALARKFGAAVIALTIDEEGMAKDAERKLRCRPPPGGFRLHAASACRNPTCMFDPLTFTICTGNEDDRKLGLWTLDAIERHRTASCRSIQIILGLSNISFGLNAAARVTC